MANYKTYLMELKLACSSILKQLANVIEQISDEDYTRPSITLNGSTIGQHFRHSLEFFECLASGYDTGKLNYDNRDHDENIETSRVLAIEVIRRSESFVMDASLDRDLLLEVNYAIDSEDFVQVKTNLAREIVYNIEHVVHHMALVKIGLKEISPDIRLPDGFGVAVSTIKYHRSQA